MEQLDEYKVRLSLVCLVTVMFLASGHTNADFTFGTPTKLPSPVNSPSDIDTTPCISPDGLELYFDSWREGSLLKPDGNSSEDIWVATRATTEDEWGAPVNLGPPVNSTYNEWGPSLSADGLEFYFCSVNRPGGYGLYDIWVTTRATISEPWGEPVNLGPNINSSRNDGGPCISADGLELFFGSERSGGYGYADIWVTTRATRDDPWSEPVNLGPEVNSPYGDFFPSISANGRWLFFGSGFGMGVYPPRPGGYGECDLWVTKRAKKDEPWGKPLNLGPIVNTVNDESTPSVSSDGSMLYFSFMRANSSWNNTDLWQVEILPVVDFNGDGIVDATDMCIMVDHWGENYSLCDIGPSPLGDGIVDIEDLIVLAEHLFEDYRIIAHWPLDEQMGNIACDCVGEHDGTLHGEPVWQPDDGVVAGALKFDGIDDYLSTPFVLNPKESPFSVTAWIKGGATGQVIISQSNTISGRGTIPGCTWLGINPSEGRLMTGLMDTTFGPLESDSIITDGQWHHIGLVYDLASMKRYLYIDGAEVAVDSDFIGGVQTTGGLNMGAGQALDATSFFSGLIDDVRIYNMTLSVEEIASMSY